MAEEAHEQIRVQARPALCFGYAVDFEEYPSWAKDVKQIAVLERDAQGRGSRVEFHVSAMGKHIHYVLAYDWSEAPAARRWDSGNANCSYWSRNRAPGRLEDSPACFTSLCWCQSVATWRAGRAPADIHHASSERLGTSEKSSGLNVTKVARCTRAWAAIIRSSSFRRE